VLEARGHPVGGVVADLGDGVLEELPVPGLGGHAERDLEEADGVLGVGRGGRALEQLADQLALLGGAALDPPVADAVHLAVEHAVLGAEGAKDLAPARLREWSTVVRV
jgi:hypothetical protein